MQSAQLTDFKHYCSFHRFFRQADTKISGACRNPANKLALSGEVNGNNVSWSYESDYQGTKVTLVFKGILEAGTSMKGKIETNGASGEFTAKKQ